MLTVTQGNELSIKMEVKAMVVQGTESPWDTETGLPNDVDGWVANPRFGLKDEYAQVVQAAGGEGNMLILDLVSKNGELIGSQGYSIGTGWIISDDGMEISHPKRKNVVGSSMYGQLQNRVRKELNVPMENRGLPTQAKSWAGLGFHWMLQEHAVVAGGQKAGLMPVEYLGEREAGAIPAPKVVGVPSDLELRLKELAQTNDVKAFQKAAVKMPEVVSNDSLMGNVLDEGPSGFWATHQ